MSLTCSKQLFPSSLELRKSTIGNVEHLLCNKLDMIVKGLITSPWIRKKRRILKSCWWSKGRKGLLNLLTAFLSWFWWPLLQFTPYFLMISEVWELIWHKIMCFMDCLVLLWPCLLLKSSFQAMPKIIILILFSFGLT